jgi:hypothetical protein
MNSRKNNKRPSVPKGAPVQTGGFFYRPKASETKEKPKKNSKEKFLDNSVNY